MTDMLIHLQSNVDKMDLNTISFFVVAFKVGKGGH
jgi:hypothetical protein